MTHEHDPDEPYVEIPVNAITWLNVGTRLLQENDYQAALEAVAPILNEDTTIIDADKSKNIMAANALLAAACVGLKQYPRALEYYDAAISNEEAPESLLFERAQILLYLKKPLRAENDFNRLAGHDREHIQARILNVCKDRWTPPPPQIKKD